jgi:hypothetical protein
MYRPGDHVYLADTREPVLCRVTEVEIIGAAAARCEILKLRPLDGPLPPGTVLVRPGRAVRPADDPTLDRRRRRRGAAA